MALLVFFNVSSWVEPRCLLLIPTELEEGVLDKGVQGTIEYRITNVLNMAT